MPRANRTIAVALIAALAAVAATRRFLPDLLSPFRFEDDARQHVWWTYRFADPGLFKGDLAADYFSGLTFAPLGYQALAAVFVPHVDAQTFAEIVPFAITAIVAFLAVLLGRSVSRGSWLGGVVAAVFALLGGVLSRVDGGLPRSWAMPVLMFGLWALIEKRWAWFGASLLATAVFYPPLIVNLGLVGGAVLMIDLAQKRRLPKGWIPLAACGVAALLIVVIAYRSRTPDPMGPKVTGAIARTMAEFGPDGRSQFFSTDPVDYYVSNRRSGLGIDTGPLIVACCAIALFAWLLPHAVPLTVWLLPVTALLGYFAAHATLFKLHLPSRYTRFALPAFLMLWLAAIVPAAVERLRRFKGVDRAVELFHRPSALLIAGTLSIALFAALSAVHVRRETEVLPSPGYPELIRFLSGLPENTLLAAHPLDASDLPLLSRRSVIACAETSTPYDLGYYARMKERIFAELRACYASDWREVDRLNREYGVDVFVADLNRYKKPVDLDAVYFEPFRSEVRERVAQAEKAGFVLENPPDDRVLFRSGRFVAVRVKSGD